MELFSMELLATSSCNRHVFSTVSQYTSGCHTGGSNTAAVTQIIPNIHFACTGKDIVIYTDAHSGRNHLIAHLLLAMVV